MVSLGERPFSVGQAQHLCSSALSTAGQRVLSAPRLSRRDLCVLRGANSVLFSVALGSFTLTEIWLLETVYSAYQWSYTKTAVCGVGDVNVEAKLEQVGGSDKKA